MKTRKLTIGLCLLLAPLFAAPASADEADSRAQKQMKKMDANRDQSVSLEEFTTHRRAWAAKQTDPEMRMQPDVVQRAFGRVDRNRDGGISHDELRESLKASKKPT
ncbi:hypothetical protein [Erythrobacter sp.]|uniref:hypothetical protein n=1 Tax=Erythrobacter sp. TaxID=1042 RepID=UPI0025DB04C3|nr:hypothetical protein [Erythrobacter sp.]